MFRSPLIFLALLAFCLLQAACADIRPEMPLAFTELNFPALVNGQDAVMVHLDNQGRVSSKTIDFLTGQTLQGLEAATLDQVVTLEKSAADKRVFELKYYHHQVLAKTFTIENADMVNWMLLLPEKNYLFVKIQYPNNKNIPPHTTYRYDLATGERKEVVFTSKATGQVYRGGNSRPLWDAAQGNLIAVITQDWPKDSSSPNRDAFLASMFPREFLGRVNPDDLSVKDGTIFNCTGIEELLNYNQVSNSVTCYGLGEEGSFISGIFGGPSNIDPFRGFVEIPLDTGKPHNLIRDTGKWIPDQPMVNTNFIASLSPRYVILTRTHRTRVGGDNVAQKYTNLTYLVDLKNHGWQALTDIPYLTWAMGPSSRSAQLPPAQQLSASGGND